MDGKPAWKVEMTPKEGKPETFFFDRDSGLLVRISAVLSTALGDIATEATMSDFRPVDGILTPFAMTEKAMSQNIVMRFARSLTTRDDSGRTVSIFPMSVKAKRDQKK